MLTVPGPADHRMTASVGLGMAPDLKGVLDVCLAETVPARRHRFRLTGVQPPDRLTSARWRMVTGGDAIGVAVGRALILSVSVACCLGCSAPIGSQRWILSMTLGGYGDGSGGKTG